MTENLHSAGRIGVSARVDSEVFTRLDEMLGAYLRNGASKGDADTRAIYRVARQNLIEEGSLGALNISRSDAALDERLLILERAYPALRRYKDKLNIEATLLAETFQLYIPMAQFMAARGRAIREREGRAALFGINGAQGSGKTTINVFLQIILGQGLGLKTAGLSIDDVYKTHEQREQMARTVHPLFAIRSVAGTHDTELARTTLTELMHAPAGAQVRLPRFDKMARNGRGDRIDASEWPMVEGPLDLIIFEGWMVGARPQSANALLTPINEREASEDPGAVWRTTMNTLLASDYDKLFELLDELVVIQVRSMDDVYRNRELQEQHLRRRLEDARQRGEDTGELGAMSTEEVAAFISLYERTTRHMLDTLPDEARITLFLGDHHRIERVRVNPPSAGLSRYSNE